MKKLILLIISVFCFSILSAQDDGESSSHSQTGQSRFGSTKTNKKMRKNVFLLGANVGGSFSSMSQPDECDLYDGRGIGLQGGVMARFRFGQATKHSVGGTGLLGASIELKYTQNKVKTIADDDLEIDYFTAPVSVQLYPFYKSKGAQNLYIEAGAALAGTLSSKPDVLRVSSVQYKTGDIAGYDVRPLLGLGYMVPNTGLNLNARYYMGTSDLAGNMACKMSSFEVSIGWLFNLGKF